MERGALKINERLKNSPDFSVSSRFFVSLLSNILRGGLSFATGIIIARSLGPDLFGDYIFLCSSFTAILFLIDLGTSKAFFTFISQKQPGFTYILFYAIWQALQFIVSLLIISLALPESWMEALWLGQDRTTLLLAFAAIFLQMSAWKTIISIGESLRMTRRLQLMNICLSGILFIVISGTWFLDLLTIRIIFILIGIEYGLAVGIAVKLFSIPQFKGDPFHLQDTLRKYRTYCSPLIIMSVFSFGYQFTDRWFLQNFGGSVEQGFYGIAYQFAAVCLIGTTSLVNIFWKEIAEAQEKRDFDRVHDLYQKVCRFLYFGAAILCGFLIPWRGDIVQIFLGNGYKASAITLGIMFLFPVHQSLAYFTHTLFFATENTKAQLYLRCIFWGVSIPVSYLVLAPKNAMVPGLELGAMGMAWKVVILQILSVNLMIWWISREFKWKFDWAYQVISLSVVLFFGWIAHEVVMGINSIFMMNLFLTFGIAFLLYSLMSGMFLWFFPWVAGLSREEILSKFSSLRGLIFGKSGESVS